jgi:hypothetical protein
VVGVSLVLLCTFSLVHQLTKNRFLISVGTPPQNFTVLPATSSPQIYVPVADDCQRINRTDCGESRGVMVFGSRPSLGFQVNASSTWELIGLYEIGVNRDLGYTGNGISGYDTIGLGKNSVTDAVFLRKQALTAYASPKLWVGHLGLGIKEMTFRQNERVNSTLLSLKNDGVIPSLSFGYTAGAPYRRFLNQPEKSVSRTEFYFRFNKSHRKPDIRRL